MKKKPDYKLPRHYEVLGAYLQEVREAALLTQRTVANRLGYSSAQFISNFERGIAAPPVLRMRSLIKLYRADRKKIIELFLLGEKTKLEGEI